MPLGGIPEPRVVAPCRTQHWFAKDDRVSSPPATRALTLPRPLPGATAAHQPARRESVTGEPLSEHRRGDLARGRSCDRSPSGAHLAPAFPVAMRMRGPAG